MSGGSFNYLYCKDVDQLLEAREQLDAMRDALVERGLSDVVAEHDAIVKYLRNLQSQMDGLEKIVGRLSPIWKAIEWHASHDWGPERVELAVEAYRSGSSATLSSQWPEIVSVQVQVDGDEPYETHLITLVRPRGCDPTVFPVRDAVTVGVAAPGQDTLLTVTLGRADRASACRLQKPVRATDTGRLLLQVPVPRGEDEDPHDVVTCFFVHIGFGPEPEHASHLGHTNPEIS